MPAAPVGALLQKQPAEAQACQTIGLIFEGGGIILMSNAGIIGIDVGGTNFRIGTIATDGTVQQFRKIPVREVFRSAGPLEDLCTFLHRYISEGRIEITAISIGFPATIDRDRKRVLQAPNLPYMENLPVVEYLTRELGIPVFIERDVTLVLYYDMIAYDIPRRGIISGFYFGTGVGNAIFLDGSPLIGKNGTAGELGHIPVDGSTLTCGCGNVGCMENLAGGKYLRSLTETVYPDTPIGELFTQHSSEPPLIRYVDRMAQAVATEINILDPDYVLIGGGVLAMKDFPRRTLEEMLLKRVRKPYPAENLQLLFPEDRPEKGVVGAAYFAMDLMKQTPPETEGIRIG